jgi:hypothetical protein
MEAFLAERIRFSDNRVDLREQPVARSWFLIFDHDCIRLRRDPRGGDHEQRPKRERASRGAHNTMRGD